MQSYGLAFLLSSKRGKEQASKEDQPKAKDKPNDGESQSQSACACRSSSCMSPDLVPRASPAHAGHRRLSRRRHIFVFFQDVARRLLGSLDTVNTFKAPQNEHERCWTIMFLAATPKGETWLRWPARRDLKPSHRHQPDICSALV